MSCRSKSNIALAKELNQLDETHEKIIKLGEEYRRVNRELLKLKHDLKSVEFVEGVCPACKGKGRHESGCWLNTAINS